MTTVGNINIETTTINTQKKVNEQLNNDSNKSILSFQESNQKTQKSGNLEITTAEDAVDFALDLIKLNSESPKSEQFRKDVSFKYNNMIRVAEETGQNLNQEMIQIRLTNYVKGWSFNQFEQDAAKDAKYSKEAVAYSNALYKIYSKQVNREENGLGVCKVSSKLKVARAALHFWEEPCISGTNGS